MITGINVYPGNLRLIDTVSTIRQYNQDTTYQDQCISLYPGNQALPGYTNNDICGMYIYNEETPPLIYTLPVHVIIRIDIIPFYSNSGHNADFSPLTDKRGVQEFFYRFSNMRSAKAILDFSDIPY